ncbi:hypothetical protein JTB14_005743 [Gonioctena quinquepunctata]|nr:hypothetical protein JTB14_005743 [Gonioctena quinquepunctata]
MYRKGHYTPQVSHYLSRCSLSGKSAPELSYRRHKSYTGEELPYVFGVPLGGPKFHFVDKYTKEEQMLSEIVMMYFSNFARTGDPNMPRRQTSYSMSLKQWAQFDVDWPEFDTQEERFIELGILPKPSNHYRERKMKYWNRIFPNLGNKSIPEVLDTSHISERTPQILNRIRTSPKNKYENFNKPFKSTSSGDFGIVTMIGERKPDNMEEGEFGIIVDSPPEEVKQSSTSNIVTIVCVLFLIVNLFLLVVLYFKCYRNKASGDSPTNTIEVSEDKGQKEEETFLVDGCNIIRMMNRSSESNDTYKAVRASTTPKYKLSRERSGSTIDAHTKVREWIAQEIIHKYSPRFFRRSEPDTMKVPVPDKFIVPVSEDKESTLGRSPTRPVSPVEQKYIPMKTSTVRRHKFKVPKVSVAVDATPFGRGPSVLMQQPIEFTKSLDYPNVEPEIELPLRRSSTLEDFSSKTTNKEKKLTKSSTSVHMNLPEMEPTIIKISHYHSKSDPVRDLDYTAMKRLKTFDPNQSVNVTCRDEDKCPIPLTPEESLDTIKRRNFPKVLPDHPGKKVLTKKRLSMPTHGFNVPIGYPSSFFPSDPAMEDSHNKFPPAPPPRASTLVKQSSSPLPVFISEPSLAEEPEEEPEIVCNNFYVGPLIPKRQLGKTFETHGSLGDIKSMKPIEYISNKCGIVIPDEQKQNFKDMSDENNDNSISSECKIDHRVEIQTEPGVQCTKSNKSAKKSQIPTLVKTSSINKESSSSDSTPSEESDTGTIVKKT